MDRPNIVLIMADDMGIGDVTAYNKSSKIPTPNMDALAKDGLKFTDMHSPSAVCTPSRYGLLTGRYSWRTYKRAGIVMHYEEPLIHHGRTTLASLLKEAGYSTGCFGKWHLGMNFKGAENFDFSRLGFWGAAHPEESAKIDFTAPVKGGPTDIGFDYFFGTANTSTCQEPYGFMENDSFVETDFFYNPEYIPTGRAGMTARGWDHKMADPTFTEKAVDWITDQADKDQPFFAYIAASAPHEPCTKEVTPEFMRGVSDAGPRGDLVALFDWMVGQVINTLKKADIFDNTLIIVTSDNGALPGDRLMHDDGEEWRDWGHKSSMDYRGYKAHIWEGGHREPFIAHWTDKIPAGRECNAMLGFTDVIATISELTGTELPYHAGEDSYSFLEQLYHPDTPSPREDIIHISGSGVFSLRKGNWKYIEGSKSSGGWAPPRGETPYPNAPGQLYNLEDDPYETNDLYEKMPEKVEELKRLLGGYRSAGRSARRS